MTSNVVQLAQNTKDNRLENLRIKYNLISQKDVITLALRVLEFADEGPVFFYRDEELHEIRIGEYE